MTKRYWLNRIINCPKRGVKCPKCKKWLKCIDKFVKLSHDRVDTGIKSGHSPTDTKYLRFKEEIREKPNGYRDNVRKGSRQRCTSSSVFIVKRARNSA
jgi:hypothetical protein